MSQVVTEEYAIDEIKRIVQQAEKFVVIISPFVSPKNINELLAVRNPNVFMMIYCLSPSMHQSLTVSQQNELSDYLIEVAKLKNNKNLQLHSVELKDNELCPSDYHALFHCKCYFNESHFLVSSMNLSSNQTKCELGLLVNKNDEPDAYESLITWYLNDFCPKVHVKPMEQAHLLEHPELGACIRCGVTMPFNTNTPYCTKCLAAWLKGGGWDDEREKFCHACGQEANVCAQHPMHKRCRHRHLHVH